MNRRPEPIRVASIQTSVFYGGDENRLLSYLHHFDRSRFHHTAMVILESSASGEQAGGPMLDRYRATGVDMVCLGETSFKERRRLPGPLDAGRKAWTFGRVVRRLAAALRARRIEVVDARLSLGTAIARAAARLAGDIPVVATNYGVAFWGGRKWLPGQLAFGGVDTLVCDSQAKLSEIERWLLRRPRTAHVPNGIPLPEPQRSRASMCALLGVPPEAPIVGQVARLLDFKGQDRVVEAAPRILEAVPEAHFVLCGYPQRGGDFHRRLVERIEALGLTERVKIVGYPGPIADVWAAIDLHVHPTRLDSSPIAILEAMAMGRPTISTDIGGIGELIEHGRSGLVLRDGEPPALAEAVIGLLRDPAARAAMGQAAHARYQRQHRPEIMARHMERLLEAAARGR